MSYAQGDIIGSLLSVAPHLRSGMGGGSSYALISCPFHGGGKERTPSMSVSREKPLFYCHSCQESGHVSRLFRHYGTPKEMIDKFIEAAGMNVAFEKAKLGKVGARVAVGEDPFRGRFILEEDILNQFRLAPLELVRAGFEKETLRHFEVGFDRTNLRITFPLRNIYGDLVGVSGRAVVDGMEPRYKIYKKEFENATVDSYQVPDDYSMDSVKEAILWHAHIIHPVLFREHGAILVTEGFKAAMWLWQAGFRNVVALVGAYLTEFHSEILATHTDTVILFLDNNAAGKKGTYYGARQLEKRNVDTWVAFYPDERQQPDDLSYAEVDEAINKYQTFSEWRESNHVISDEAARHVRPRW